MPSPVTMLMTPGGSPASSSSAMRKWARELLGVRRLPHHGVAHERRRRRQVPGDRREVERRDGVDEALERSVVGAVPDAGRRDRLLGQDLPGEVDVVAPEVDELAGSVDLRLERGLRLAEQRGAVQRLPPRAGEQVRGLEEDRRPVVEGQLPPRSARPPSRRGRPPARRRWSTGGSRRARGGGRAAAPPRRARPEAGRRSPPTAIVRSTGRRLQLGDPGLERGPLGAAGCVEQHRLVDRLGHPGDGVQRHGERLLGQRPVVSVDDPSPPSWHERRCAPQRGGEGPNLLDHEGVGGGAGARRSGSSEAAYQSRSRSSMSPAATAPRPRPRRRGRTPPTPARPDRSAVRPPVRAPAVPAAPSRRVRRPRAPPAARRRLGSIASSPTDSSAASSRASSSSSSSSVVRGRAARRPVRHGRGRVDRRASRRRAAEPPSAAWRGR